MRDKAKYNAYMRRLMYAKRHASNMAELVRLTSDYVSSNIPQASKSNKLPDWYLTHVVIPESNK